GRARRCRRARERGAPAPARARGRARTTAPRSRPPPAPPSSARGPRARSRGRRRRGWEGRPPWRQVAAWKGARQCAASGRLRLAPPAGHVELDRRERLEPKHSRPLVRARHDPALALEPIDLDRAGERVDEPEVRDLLASVHAELPPAIDVSRRGRDHLAHPVRRKREPDHVREHRHPLPAPPGEIRDEYVVAEVQLRLVEDPPPAWRVSASRRPVEAIEERAPDRRGG